MDDKIHQGHRERMRRKLFDMPDSLNDHEILEIILFAVIPRKNTNAIAHALLQTYGYLEGVLRASPAELAATEGIGPHSAAHFKAVYALYQRIDEQKKEISGRFTYHTFRDRLIEFFDHPCTEQFIVLLLDKKQKIVKKLTFDSNFVNRVEVDMTQFAHEIALSKPDAVILMHNHPSGNVLPTESDDHATGRIALALALHNVQLYDHIVVTEHDSYSYHYAGRMKRVLEQYDLKQILKNI